MIQTPDHIAEDLRNKVLDFTNYEILFNEYWGFTMEVDRKYIIKVIFDPKEAALARKAKKFQFQYSANWLDVIKIRLTRPLGLYYTQKNSGERAWIIIMESQEKNWEYVRERVKYGQLKKNIENYFQMPLGYDFFETKGIRKLTASVKEWSITPISDRPLVKELFEIHKEFAKKGLRYDYYQIQNMAHNDDTLKANFIYSGKEEENGFNLTNKKYSNIDGK